VADLEQFMARLRVEALDHEPGLPASNVPVMVAYGAGVDSTAMLIELVESGVRIDIVLFADTGSEKPATYAYLELFREWLAARGVTLIVVRYQPKNYKNFPPYRSLDENCFTNGTLPSISFGFSSCSQKWKIEPQNRWTEQWAPARLAWSAGSKVIKLIGYDCSPADAKRYAHREGHVDDRFVYGYPLRELGWCREDCEARIRAAGLPVPPKSACSMCGAMKPWEVHTLPPEQLRRIVLMEARAAPRLRQIEGLWRNGVKGTRGAEKRPGRITDYIRQQGLLPAAEIDAIIAMAPAALVRFQADQATAPVGERADLGKWLALFDRRDQGAFDAAGAAPLYRGVNRPSDDAASRRVAA
jgi:hypothetical protein